MCPASDVSVIVPTRAVRERGPLIRRAVSSILDQEGVLATALVVINGPDQDPELVEELQSIDGVRVRVLEQASLSGALAAGRDMVDSTWFATLDDDDILLPGALARRVRVLQEDPSLDVVVTNGIRREADGDVLHVDDPPALGRDPLRALLRENWLLPGSWLCRTQSVGPWLFDDMPAHRECTWLAFQFSTRCRLRFLDRPTVVWHKYTPDSMSKSRGYVLAGPAAHQRYLELELPDDVRASLERQTAGLFHDIADLHLRDRQFRAAWSWHIDSLLKPGGWRFLPFTRHFLRALWRD